MTTKVATSVAAPHSAPPQFGHILIYCKSCNAMLYEAQGEMIAIQSFAQAIGALLAFAHSVAHPIGSHVDLQIQISQPKLAVQSGAGVKPGIAGAMN